MGGVGRKSGGTKFDGYKNGVLLEAKGPGYAEFFEANLDPKDWFKHSDGAEDILRQARRQRDRVNGLGIPIEWHVAEKHAADAIRKMLDQKGITEIKVIHTPAH